MVMREWYRRRFGDVAAAGKDDGLSEDMLVMMLWGAKRPLLNTPSPAAAGEIVSSGADNGSILIALIDVLFVW